MAKLKGAKVHWYQLSSPKTGPKMPTIRGGEDETKKKRPKKVQQRGENIQKKQSRYRAAAKRAQCSRPGSVAMHTALDMTDFLVHKISTFKYLSLLPLLWQPTTALLNPLHIFIFSYSFNSIYLFHPVLIWIYMSTGLRCQARWRIIAAAHNICVLIGQIVCQSSSLRMVNSRVFS